MNVLRTPDDRFADLPGFSFEPNYVEVGDGLRMHYLDEGDPGAPPVLLLHGEPSWSYLYRKMIPVITGAGLRALAPDFIGFGRSDKPAERSDYTYRRHLAWLRQWLDALGVAGLTLYCQDWGGLLGLRLVAESPERFARVVAANTFLPTGDQPLGAAWHKWLDFSQNVETFRVGWSVNRGCVTELPEAVVAAYDAPFPDESYKAGVRQFPALVPASPDDPETEANRAAWEALAQFDMPFLTAFSDSDPITRGADLWLQGIIPGASGRDHPTIEGAGHFLQEDKGEECGEVVVRFVEQTS